MHGYVRSVAKPLKGRMDAGQRSSALTSAVWRGGTATRNKYIERHSITVPVCAAEKRLKAMAMPTASIALKTAISLPEGRCANMKDDFTIRLSAYRTALALLRAMVAQGVIAKVDEAKCQTALAEKYGFSSCSIFY